jgi:predicted amidohydrolase
MFIVFSNGVGRDDDEVRTGNAMLVDPCGRVIAESLAITDDMVAADLDLDQAAASVGQWWLRFRRPELYRPLVRQAGDVNAAAAG